MSALRLGRCAANEQLLLHQRVGQAFLLVAFLAQPPHIQISLTSRNACPTGLAQLQSFRIMFVFILREGPALRKHLVMPAFMTAASIIFSEYLDLSYTSDLTEMKCFCIFPPHI